MSMQAASLPPSGKALWRRRFRDLLKAHPHPEAESAEIRQHLSDALQDRAKLRIAAFAALPGEMNLLPLMADFPNHEWCFPRIHGDNLIFHQIDHPAELSPGFRNILEPEANRAAVSPSTFDLILCPGLGFGRDGSRLGRGRGYYDRTLAHASTHASVIGVALPYQLVDRLPTEPHDHFMDQLATIEGMISCSSH
jgi:5-formyltetrahydrofolate cyclo-ligase